MYNGHADVTALIDASGTIQATYYYDAFGNLMTQTGNVNNPFTYAGYQYDNESGLYYLNARYYDPVTARFITEDTYLGDKYDPLSLNLYTYCHNEPIMYVDPSGHTEAQLRDLVAAAGGEVGWNNETRTATATINGVEKKFKIEDFKVEDGRIIIDSAKFDSMFSNNKVSISSRVESKKITATTVTNSSGSYYGGKSEKISSTINNYQKSSNLIKPVANGTSNSNIYNGNSTKIESEAKKEIIIALIDTAKNPVVGLVELIVPHYFTRADLNSGAPQTETDAKNNGWKKLPAEQSVFHQQGIGNESNVKYVSPDGKSEGVFKKNGKMVTDPVNMPTYNYSPPNNKLGHALYDVIPYYLLGNSLDDPTSFADRIIASFKAFK